MNTEKTITECPVCHSTDVKQLTETNFFSEHFMIYGAGSYCNNCGVKLVFNTQGVDRLVAKIKRAIEKGEELARKELKE